MWLFVLFIAIPLIEIALFIQVGGLLGLWPTLAIVIATALLGTSLLRAQGAQAMADLRRSMNALQDPSESLAHGAMILFAGALLLTPGFFTDALGFALMVPAFRKAVFHRLRSRIEVQSSVQFETAPGPRARNPQDRVIDGEFEEVTPKTGAKRPSGWTDLSDG